MLALLGAAMFVLHPIASECVYPAASGRESMLPAFFCLCALYFFRPTPSCETLDALAAAYAEQGLFPQAVTTAEQALALANTDGRENLVVAIQNRLHLYKQDQAFISR